MSKLFSRHWSAARRVLPSRLFSVKNTSQKNYDDKNEISSRFNNVVGDSFLELVNLLGCFKQTSRVFLITQTELIYWLRLRVILLGDQTRVLQIRFHWNPPLYIFSLFYVDSIIFTTYICPPQ